MKISSITPLLAITTCFLCSNTFAANQFTHFSGDNINAADVTGASITQVIEATASGIQFGYGGTFTSTRGNTGVGDNAFYNEHLGAIPDSTRFSTSFVADAGNITVSTGPTTTANLYDVTAGAGVTSITLTYSYLGQFHAGEIYNEGFTGRYSSPEGAPGTNFRGFTLRNFPVDPGAETLNFVMSATDFGGSASTLEAEDFYAGLFSGGDYIAADSGYGTTSVEADVAENDGLYFHNGSDLGDMLTEVQFVITAADGELIDEGTQFRLTFDAMTHATTPVVVPEPTSLLYISLASIALVCRRRRPGTRALSSL